MAREKSERATFIELPSGMELSITATNPPEFIITGRLEKIKEDVDALIADIKAEGEEHPFYPWLPTFEAFRKERL